MCTFGKLFCYRNRGMKRNIHRKDFLVFAESCGLNRKSAEKMIEKIVALKDMYIGMCRESYLPDDMKERFEALICERMAVLAAPQNR